MVAGEARAVHSLEYQGSLMNNQMKQQQQQQHHYYTGDFLLGFFILRGKISHLRLEFLHFRLQRGRHWEAILNPKMAGNFKCAFFRLGGVLSQMRTWARWGLMMNRPRQLCEGQVNSGSWAARPAKFEFFTYVVVYNWAVYWRISYDFISLDSPLNVL